MYPSKEDLLFGVFVKKTVKNLTQLGAIFTKEIVIKGKRNNFFKKIFAYFNYYFKAIKNIFSKDEDVIYVHFLTHNIPVLLFYLKFRKTPIVLNLHGSDINKVKESSFTDKIQGKILNKVTQIIVPSMYFKEVLRKRYQLKTPIYIYPSGGINTELFKPASLKQNENFIISFVSRIDKGKGWKTFLTLVEKMNQSGIETEALIAGDGKEKEVLLEAIKNHPYKNQITYLGFQEKEKLANIYQQSDAFIFATELPESLGLVGLEAMACGSIVFARKIGGPAYYINNNENGFLFLDDDDLFSRITEFYNTSSERKNNLKKNAITTAIKYNSKEVSLNLYKNFTRIHEQN
ncbi:glycosyltransferase family 4 protein [Mesonia maritima]|nr:glycosyltransferase family 4 protein [Mesonia maritima]